MFLKSLAGSPRVKKMINTEVSSMNEIQVISTAWSISTCECNNDTIKLQWRCNSIDVDDGESTSTSSASPLLMLHHVTVKLHYSVAKIYIKESQWTHVPSSEMKLLTRITFPI